MPSSYWLLGCPHFLVPGRWQNRVSLCMSSFPSCDNWPGLLQPLPLPQQCSAVSHKGRVDASINKWNVSRNSCQHFTPSIRHLNQQSHSGLREFFGIILLKWLCKRICKYFPWCLNASKVSQGRESLHSPLLRFQGSSTDPSPAQQDPLPLPHSTGCCNLESWVNYSLFSYCLSFFSSKKPTDFTAKRQNSKSQRSHFNYVIYNYIQPFNCWLQSIF